MPLAGYGVCVGRPTEVIAERTGASPHFQIHVETAGQDFRVAVNTRSMEVPPECLYYADEHFDHPILADVMLLPDGFTALASQPDGTALDYSRGDLFDRTQMIPAPDTADGPDNDLSDALDLYASRATADPLARLFAFGQRWGPADQPDPSFGFSPGNGVHDIHMNQGNDATRTSEDGVWQDGGLFFHFPNEDQWVAVFLAFQSQAWLTDDATGHPITDQTCDWRG